MDLTDELNMLCYACGYVAVSLLKRYKLASASASGSFVEEARVDSERHMSRIREVARNTSIYSSAKEVLMRNSFTVIGNKSRFVSSEQSKAVSLCSCIASWTWRLSIFQKSAMIYILEGIGRKFCCR